jgi:homoserine O-acetyltransferase/O-succinyltransferase
LPLEWSPEPLPAVTMAYETWGELSPARDNAVLVLHALTGDSHVVGEAGPGHSTPGWWGTLIGPGGWIDTDRWYVVAANILGGCQGSTGPASVAPDGRVWGSRFPRITTRDQVAAELALADLLGIERWALLVGGSAGGMRAVEWAVTAPERVQRMLLLATTAAAAADQIAWCRPQVQAIRSDPAWAGGDYDRSGPGPVGGLAVARQIAHVTYRSAEELAIRFGRSEQLGESVAAGGRYAVESYLDHHGAKLVGRFDAGSYVTLTEAMDSHDVGRGRGGIEAALATITARTVVAGIDSDRLYPLSQSVQLAAGIPTAGPLRVIESPYGHDGFLIEVEAVGRIVAELLSC